MLGAACPPTFISAESVERPPRPLLPRDPPGNIGPAFRLCFTLRLDTCPPLGASMVWALPAGGTGRRMQQHQLFPGPLPACPAWSGVYLHNACGSVDRLQLEGATYSSSGLLALLGFASPRGPLAFFVIAALLLRLRGLHGHGLQLVELLLGASNRGASEASEARETSEAKCSKSACPGLHRDSKKCKKIRRTLWSSSRVFQLPGGYAQDFSENPGAFTRTPPGELFGSLFLL